MAKNLTAVAVEKVKPDPAKRLEIADGLLPGLYLVVQPSGRKSWAVRYRAAGDTRKLTIGGYPVLKLDQARDAAREALRAAQKGADPATEKREARRAAKDRTEAERDAFDAVARRYLDRYARPKNRGWLEQARLLGLVPDRSKSEGADDPGLFLLKEGGLAERWQGKRVQEITRRDVLEAIDEVVARGAPVGANRTLAALRTMLNWTVDRGIITANPAETVKPPTAEMARDRVLSDEELRAVWMAADTMAWPMGRVVQLLILTGQRRDEVSEMAEREVDRSRRMWTIPRDRAKNDVEHDVPLSDAALAILDGLPKISGRRGYLFTSTGETPVSGHSNAKERLDKLALAELRKRAAERGEDADAVELRPWRLHDIRRSVATRMQRLRIGLQVVEAVLGHVSGSRAGVVGIYQRYEYEDEKREALDAWARFVTALVADKPAGNVVELRGRA